MVTGVGRGAGSLVSENTIATKATTGLFLSKTEGPWGQKIVLCQRLLGDEPRLA